MLAITKLQCTSLFGSLLLGLLLGCGDSSGPGDTTIVLSVDEVPANTNQPTQVISGTTDPGATVTITATADTLSGTASGGGSFSLSIDLALNSPNVVAIRARDQAGNERSATVNILHDNIAPAISFTSPPSAQTTPSQKGFTVSLTLADESSGIDLNSFVVQNDRSIGGIFRSDGSTSVSFAAGMNLTALFGSIGVTAASWVVQDSAIFPAGDNRLTAQVADAAGNSSAMSSRSFQVGADPDNLILVDASGAPGSTENPVTLGLANALELGGVQFDLLFDTLVIAALDSVTVTGRAATFDDPPVGEIARGQVRVLLFDSGGDAIAPGQGPILTLWLSVDAAAASATHILTLDNIVVASRAGDSSSVPTVTGSFTVP